MKMKKSVTEKVAMNTLKSTNPRKSKKTTVKVNKSPVHMKKAK